MIDKHRGKRVMAVISSETYENLRVMATNEKRTISKMIDVLICEAINTRENNSKWLIFTTYLLLIGLLKQSNVNQGN